MTDDVPSFDIPRRPERTFPREGGVEYEGGTVFRLSPDPTADEDDLVAVVEDVLESDRYTYGDWFELPAPVYLVHDEDHSTAFRVVIRYRCVEFHVLPGTVPAALEGMYARLDGATDYSWAVDCETTSAE